MKKLKTWWLENRDEIATIVVTILLMITTCFFGYVAGTTDGYAEGYVSANTNQYTQLPDRLAFKNAFDYGTSLKQNAQLLLEGLSKSNEQKIIHHNINIQYEDNAANIDDEINEALALIPESIIQRFEEEEWSIVISNRLPNMEYKDTEFAAVGITNSALRVIKLEALAGIATDTLLHEFGHYFDTTNGRYSDTTQWQELYAEEWSGIYILTRNFHDIDSPSEYFAEMFILSLRAPTIAQELCPQSYEVMQNLIENA